MKDGKFGMSRDGSYLNATAYWSEIINRSNELFGRETEPGVDYALTEIVHCKSGNMIGVEAALEECGRRYLLRVLKVSGARVIAAVGQRAGQILRLALQIDEHINLVGPKLIADRERYVIFLAAPGSSKPRRIQRIFSKPEIELIRSVLA